MSEADRDLAVLCLPRWGRIIAGDGPVPWRLVDQDGECVAPVDRFLREFVARGNSAGSVRSYAYALLRWWRFLRAVEVEWNRATPTEARDFSLWLQHTVKVRSAPRTSSATLAGTINPITRKQYLDDRYHARTVRHNNAVLRSFYDFWIERGEGPLINPVVRDRERGQCANAHHNPMPLS